MIDFPKIEPLGDRGILIEFGRDISPNTLHKILFYKSLIEKNSVKQKLQVINSYNSLLISYMLIIEDIYSEVSRIKELLRETNIPKKRNFKTFYIPVCYHQDFGLDLDHISKQKAIPVHRIIELHCAPSYQVYFIGFLPGFLYLGGLNRELHIPRKDSPRKWVEKGAVGIGGNQTGIYPKSSPGGWQILGRSPIELFNKSESIPCPFSPGDKIRFEAISKEKFYMIESQVAKGDYKLKMENHES